MRTPDNDLIEHLASLTAREAQHYIDEQELPFEWRTELLNAADALRKQRRKVKRRLSATQTQHAELWFRLLGPLKYELSNAKVGLRLKHFSSAPERHTAFTEYVALLEKLLAGLQKLQRDEYQKLSSRDDEAPRTPAALAEERGLPNRGQHWTDWVNERTKARINLLFEAIPWGTKRPRPFTRRIPPRQFEKDIAALQKRTLNEMATQRQELEMLEAVPNPNVEQSKRLVKLQDDLTGMQAALSQTLHMKNVPVPFTWQGVEVPVEDWGRRIATAAEVEKVLRTKFEPTPEEIAAAKHNKQRTRPKRYVK